jgi:hypothetical protein
LQPISPPKRRSANVRFGPILLKNSLAAWRLIFVHLNLQGSDLTRRRRERVCRDPFVSMMSNAVQRASKISRLA